MSRTAAGAPRVAVGDEFGYAYFDDPAGAGYRGYGRDRNGDGYLPWEAARCFCAARQVHTAIDLGCAKGFVVETLRRDGVDGAGYDISKYALSFATGLPCHLRDIRRGIPGNAEAVFALGVLPYLDEDELGEVLGRIRSATTRFFLMSGFYAGDPQDVPDPLRRITRPYAWWKSHLASAGFHFDSRGVAFDVYTV